MQAKLSLSVLSCWLLPLLLFGQSVDLHSPINSLGFIENCGQLLDQQGQSAPHVRYLLNIEEGLNLQLSDSGFSYTVYTRGSENETIRLNRLDVAWIGGAQNPQYSTEHASIEELRYPTLNQEGVNPARLYGRVVAEQVYQGIDLEFLHFDSEKISTEYNFILTEGARLSDIQLAYRGGQLLALEDDALYIQVGDHVLVEELPFSFLQNNGQPLDISYCEESSTEDQFVIGFSGPVDLVEEPIVIDPVPSLQWSTYFGGPAEDEIRDLVVDADGNLYGIGQTNSLTNIVSTGPHQSTIAGDEDILLFKFSPTGERLWSTYFGGDEKDTGEEIALGPNGEVYICATVESEFGITTSGVHQSEYGGGFLDGLIARFTPDGQLVWSTYFGGNINENCFGLGVNDQNHIYVTGRTKSFNAIASADGFQGTIGGDIDAFLAKFNSTGQLLWSTYYGGQRVDIGQSVAIADNGDVFISGWTASESGLATVGVQQTSYGGGQADIFLARFDTEGNRLWCSYLGGVNNDFSNDLATDPSGNICVLGSSFSPENIGTPGTHQPGSDGSGDAILVKFNPEGQRTWGTYYGGEATDVLNSLSYDEEGNIYAVGNAKSTEGIATSQAPQSNHAGGNWDGMLVKFNPEGQRLWSTYLGGAADDQALAVAVANPSAIYVGGTTESASGFESATAFQAQPAGSLEGFLQRYTSCNAPELSLLNGGFHCNTLPDNLQFQLSNSECASVIYSLDGIVQPPLEITTANFSWSLPAFTDSLNILDVYQGECQGTLVGPSFIQMSEVLNASAVYRDCDENSMTYRAIFSMQGGNGTYIEWDNQGAFEGNLFTSFPIPYGNPFSFRVSGSDSCDIIIINGFFDCTNVCPDLGISILGEQDYCPGESLELRVDNGEDFRWSGPNNYSSTGSDILISDLTVDQSGEYEVIVRHTFACFDTLVAEVNVHQVPVVELRPLKDLSCTEPTTELTAYPTTPGNYTYQYNLGTIQTSPTLSDVGAGSYQVRVRNEWGCLGEAIIDLPPAALNDCAIYVPTAFSPNLDGRHDYFRIFPPEGIDGRIASYQIFDRWGGLIYQASDFPLTGTTGWWDGLDRRQELVSQGVYVYAIQLELDNGGQRLLKGTINVVH